MNLYIPDDETDTGKEPNTKTTAFWKSPYIWVRNQADGVYKHENPEYSLEHPGAFVYVRVYNRGKDNYTGENIWCLLGQCLPQVSETHHGRSKKNQCGWRRFRWIYVCKYKTLKPVNTGMSAVLAHAHAMTKMMTPIIACWPRLWISRMMMVMFQE